MRNLMTCLLITVTGCASVSMTQNTPLPRDQRIFVVPFESSVGKVVSQAIAMQLDKNNLLTRTKQDADLFLTGDAFVMSYRDGVSFTIMDKDQLVYLSGTATSGGVLTAVQLGKDIGKKIAGKIQKN